MRLPLAASLLLVSLGCSGCGRSASAPPAPAPARASDSRPVVAFLGDSLTAGLGVAADEAYPAVVGRLLEEAGVRARVSNAGVSGDTSAGGRRRVAWVLSQRPDVLVVALGANDGLRGLPLEELEANLDAIVAAGQESGARVVLCGMQVPTSMGPEHARGFAAVFPRVATRRQAELVPFLLEGVALVPELNQPDGIHPTPEGHALIARVVLPHVQRALSEVAAR